MDTRFCYVQSQAYMLNFQTSSLESESKYNLSVSISNQAFTRLTSHLEFCTLPSEQTAVSLFLRVLFRSITGSGPGCEGGMLRSIAKERCGS